MDSLLRWAAQAVPLRGRRYRAEGAEIVTGTALNRRDRIVVAGDLDAVSALLVVAAAEHPDHVVLGDTELVRALPDVEPVADFGWLELLPDDPAPAVDTSGVRWLSDDDVAPVLAAANPHSWVQPGEPAVVAWAGAPPHVGAEQSEQAVSVAALAHCAADVAFLAGVATLPAHRGVGLSTTVCGFLRNHGRATRGTVALMVDADNAAAITVYQRLGFRYRSVTAARPSA